jgi:uncharacterized protein YecE (DUF72 family)
MIFVACSGFPVPVSRYWAEFPAVEIAETELGMPGPGTVRRWMREAPEGYGFSLLVPKAIIESEFEASASNLGAVKEIASLGKKIKAQATVIAAPGDWKMTRARRTAVRNFAEALPARGGPFVLSLPWPTEEVRALTKGTSATVAFDPLSTKPAKEESFQYMRLPGPAGHRSRYDDTALEKIAGCVLQSKAEVVFCTFTNIDMFANAKRTIQLLQAAKKTSK